MTVPAERMLLAFALTVIPASLAPLVRPEGLWLFSGTLLLFCCVAAADAVAVVRGMKGLSVSFPERLNLIRNRDGSLTVRIADAGSRPLTLWLGLEMPRALVTPRNSLPLTLPDTGDAVGLSWPLTGCERGVHSIERGRLRVLSPLGFWYGQKSFAAGTRVHVYPGLQEERKKLAALFLRRADMRVRPHRQIGQGREFEKLRPYLPGDSQGDIHWKATARRGHPVTKEFRIERTQEVYCIIDASRLSARTHGPAAAGAGDTILDRCLSASLLLATIAQRQGDLFGVMAFSDQPLTFLRAKGGIGHFSLCREALAGVRASLVTPNFEETAAFLASRLRRRALLMFLTSLDEPVLADSFSRAIPVLSRRHLVLAHSVKPESAVPLFSDDRPGTADEVYERLGGHLMWHGLRQARETLRLRGVELSVTDRDKLGAAVVTRYLNVKRRQIL